MKQIPLTQGYVALVDDKDFKRINRFKWYAWKHRDTFYALRGDTDVRGKRIIIYMHRAVLNCAKGEQADHRDGNGLNNRRKNLRLATNTQNRCNSKRRVDNRSGFKGVEILSNGRFRARIKISGKEHALGCFSTAQEAHMAYCRAATELHGEFARFE